MSGQRQLEFLPTTTQITHNPAPRYPRGRVAGKPAQSCLSPANSIPPTREDARPKGSVFPFDIRFPSAAQRQGLLDRLGARRQNPASDTPQIIRFSSKGTTAGGTRTARTVSVSRLGIGRVAVNGKSGEIWPPHRRLHQGLPTVRLCVARRTSTNPSQPTVARSDPAAAPRDALPLPVPPLHARRRYSWPARRGPPPKPGRDRFPVY